MTRSIRIEVKVQEARPLDGIPFSARRFSAKHPEYDEVVKVTADISARLDGLEDGEYALEVADINTLGKVMGRPATGTITVGANTGPLTYMATQSLLAAVVG